MDQTHDRSSWTTMTRSGIFSTRVQSPPNATLFCLERASCKSVEFIVHTRRRSDKSHIKSLVPLKSSLSNHFRNPRLIWLALPRHLQHTQHDQHQQSHRNRRSMVNHHKLSLSAIIWNSYVTRPAFVGTHHQR
jgi:hypothetical protein